MNFSKVLMALTAVGVNASANMSTNVTAGVSAAVKKLNMKTVLKQNFDAAGDWTAADAGVKLKDDVKKQFPVGAHLGACVMTNFAGSMMAGAGLEAAYEYMFNMQHDGVYGDFDKKGATRSFSVKHPKHVFSLTPRLAVGTEITNSFSVMASVGLKSSYMNYKVNQSGSSVNSALVDEDAASWMFGVQLGLEGVYQLSTCSSFGLGVRFTYHLESWNAIKKQGLAKKFAAAADEKAKLLHQGGTWSVAGTLSGYFSIA